MPTGPKPAARPRFFAKPQAFYDWLKKNHARASELLVGYYKKDSGQPSMTWPESVDQALCFGWIDGIRRARDALSYTVRFTPRRPGSDWSAVNVRKAEQLIKQGLMREAGLRAFAPARAGQVRIYSYEKRAAALPPAYLSQIRVNQAAWDFFSGLPQGYRATVSWWVLSAKQEATRQARLARLIARAAAGQRV